MSQGAGIQRVWVRIRDRKVVQWGLAYAAVAWAMVQVLEFAVSTFEWPLRITRVAAVLAAVGLPVTIVLAWFHGDRGHQRAGRVELAILALLLSGGALLAHQVAMRPAATGPAGPPSAAADAGGAEPGYRMDRLRIAVLPFANLGGDPANAGFVGGVHDTLITQVAKIPGLTVISRSSVLQFEDSKATIAEVARALGVGTVLEGSVQRDGNRLRIQAQLIDAATDAHLWAETYDRDADDLFAVQSEISRAVADELRIRMSVGESQRLAASMTANARAYEQYALGRGLLTRSTMATGKSFLEDAIEALSSAVALDPGFAGAHAQLGIARTWLAFEDASRRKEQLPLARAAIEKALLLDPTLPEAHLARAVYLYRGEPDYDAAASEFNLAIAELPNDALAHVYLGFLYSYQGRFEEAAGMFRRAAELDPRGSGNRALVDRLATLGRREEALAALERARAASPDDLGLVLMRGRIAVDFDCDLATMGALLENLPITADDDPQVLKEKWEFALTVGEYARAIEYVERLSRLTADDDLRQQRGWTYMLAGRQKEAAAILEPHLLDMVREQDSIPPGDARAQSLAFIARTYAWLGRAPEAIRYARAAVEELPVNGAVRQRPLVLVIAAAALARTSETAEAIELMRKVQDLPFQIRPSGQWCLRDMAPLRQDPRFRSMMEAHGADVSIDPERRETWPRRGIKQEPRQ